MYVVAPGGSEIQFLFPDSDVSTMEFGSKQVYDVLKAKGLITCS